MQNLLDDLKSLLSSDDRLLVDGELMKNKIIELAMQLDQGLISALLSRLSTKKHFFQDVGGVMVFDKIKFQQFISNKAFLPDSYTSFKNKIGLMNEEDKYLSECRDVVLAWPYKDCVLEGGQTSDDEKRNELFWNATLAPDEIDTLFLPKVFTGFKKYGKRGSETFTDISLNDNFVIKGNNLLTLHSLKKIYYGRVKLIYIDPPFNTGNDDFGYNDKFNHSSWLTFMKSRLEVAKDLLAKDGSIWINIDDIEAHYLKVLCDEMFGRDNFIANIVWQKKFSPQNDAKYFSDNHDHILVYAKSRQSFKSNLLPRSDASASRYSNPDDDTRGPWTSGDLTVKTYSAEYDYPVKTPSGKVINPTKGRCWAVSKRRFQELVADNRIWFGKNGGNVPRMKMFLSEVKEGQTPLTIWLHTDVGHNQEAKQEVNKLLEKDLFKTPKPERLIKRIIDIGSNEGDIIFDFFLGSGTTAAVALKMGRKFISCEQMDYVKSVTLVRLKKVLQGEQGGISKSVNWQGGGSFIYCELAKANQEFVDIIAKTKTAKELRDIWSTMQEKAFISYKVDIKDINKYSDNFDQLSVEDQKRFLVEILDKNHLYVNFSEIEDKDYKLSKDDKALSYKLYSLK